MDRLFISNIASGGIQIHAGGQFQSNILDLDVRREEGCEGYDDITQFSGVTFYGEILAEYVPQLATSLKSALAVCFCGCSSRFINTILQHCLLIDEFELVNCVIEEPILYPKRRIGILKIHNSLVRALTFGSVPISSLCFSLPADDTITPSLISKAKRVFIDLKNSHVPEFILNAVQSNAKISGLHMSGLWAGASQVDALLAAKVKEVSVSGYIYDSEQPSKRWIAAPSVVKRVDIRHLLFQFESTVPRILQNKKSVQVLHLPRVVLGRDIARALGLLPNLREIYIDECTQISSLGDTQVLSTGAVFLRAVQRKHLRRIRLLFPMAKLHEL